MSPRLERAVARWIPAAWRDDVVRDLAEERPPTAGAFWFAVHALRIGSRLRAAQARDAFTRPRHHHRRRHLMQDFGRELWLAVRGAARRPGYALAVIATLAIGIGANTAIFSVFNWILFRPLPGAERPSELVTVRFQTPKSDARFFVSYGDYADLRDNVTGLQGLAGSLPLTMAAGDGPDEGAPVETELVTSNYFTVLGVVPPIGRAFLPSEERDAGSIPAVVISHPLAQARFSAPAEALGREISLDGRRLRIVGIAPRGFQGRSPVTPTSVWIPVGAHALVLPHYGRELLTSRERTLFGDAIGRLRPGTTLAQAHDEAVRVAETSPLFSARGPAKRKSSIRPVLYAGVGLDVYAQERLATMFRLLMGAVGLVLLLACANAANLLLARTTARRREIAVSQAIGASRFRIVRQHLVEGLVLALAAGVAGLGLAQWLTSLFDGMRLMNFLPAVEGVRVDWRVAMFALAASITTGVLFATAPAVVGSRVDLLAALKDGSHGTRGGRRSLRAGLVTLQITVSMVLLVTAGLFIRTLHNLRTLDLGLDAKTTASVLLDPSRFGYDVPRSQRYLADVVERLRHIPGIQNAAFTVTTPYAMMRMDMRFTRPDAPETVHESQASSISRGYFDTMGIPLLAGRDFTDDEYGRENTAAGVVILSRKLADRIFPAGNALGARLTLDDPKNMQVEVVGIVGDVRGRPLTAEPVPLAYEPAGQRWAASWGHVVLRSQLPLSASAAAVRQVVRDMDPSFSPPVVESFAASIDRVLSEQRLLARFSGLFAGVAALLAGIGIYAMMAGAVAERRRELGIRLALGARGANVLRLVLRSALTLSVAGAALGLAGAAALRKVVEARLFGVSSIDPATLAAAAAAIVLLCLAASLVPAMRAARVDPVTSLRVE